MSENNNKTWSTKYGRRRVRDEAPTLAEAIAAAQGLADTIDEQVEIAASLIGLPQDQVRAAVMQVAAPRKKFTNAVVFAGPAASPRLVTVERKPARRVVSSASRTARPAFSSSRGI